MSANVAAPVANSGGSNVALRRPLIGDVVDEWPVVGAKIPERCHELLELTIGGHEFPFHQCDRITRNYDVSPDGQRFLMIEDLEPEPMPDHLTLVVNWFEELRSHFPEE